jgi:hypothetical protein
MRCFVMRSPDIVCPRPNAVNPKRLHYSRPHERVAPTPSICSSARRRLPLRPFGMLHGSYTSSQGVLWLLPLLAPHNTWQHSQSLEDKERSLPREASS